MFQNVMAHALKCLSVGRSCPGMSDHRGVAVLDVIRFMKRAFPRVVILENVKGMAMRHKEELSHVLALIREIIDPATGQATSWCRQFKFRLRLGVLDYLDQCCVHSGSTMRYQQNK